MPPFTALNVWEDWNNLGEVFKKRDELFEMYEDLYFLKHWDTTPKETERQITLPDHTNDINLAVTILTQGSPIFNILVDELKQQSRATKAEKFLYGTYYINDRVQERSVQVDKTFDSLLYGWMCSRTLWDTLRKFDPNNPSLADFPLIHQRVHPKGIRCRKGGARGPWETVAYGTEKTVADVEAEFGVKIDAENRLDTTTVVDYWTWRSHVEEGQLVHKLWHSIVSGLKVKKGRKTEDAALFIKEPTPMPEYDSIPYTIVFGIPTGHPLPEYWGMSFLFPLQDIVHDFEVLLSRVHRVMTMHGDPITLVQKADENTDIEIDKRPGSVIEAGIDDRITLLQGQGVTPDVWNALTIFRQKIQESGFSSVVYGMGLSGMAGYTANALQEGSRAKVEPYRRTLEMAYEIDNEKILRLFQQFGGKKGLKVQGQDRDNQSFVMRLTPQEIKGLYFNKAKLRPEFPADEMRAIQKAVQAKSAGLLDLYTILTDVLEVPSPERIIEGLLEDAARNDPRYQQAGVEKILQGWGIVVPPPVPPTPAEAGAQAFQPNAPMVNPMQGQQFPAPYPPGANWQGAGGTPQGPPPYFSPEVIAALQQLRSRQRA